jgi:hypothetical protein
MSGAPMHPIEIVMALALAAVGLFLVGALIGLGITVWRCVRQARRERRSHKLVGGPPW